MNQLIKVRNRSKVEFYSWNPRAPLGRSRINSRLHVGPRVANFGDLLGPVVARAMVDLHGRDVTRPHRPARLVTVGSVLHMAKNDDVIWGSGVNGRHLELDLRAERLDIRAVRGPLTREYLCKRGFVVPEVYGDPGLLLDVVRPDLLGVPPRHAVTVCINFSEAAGLSDRVFPPNAYILDPRAPLEHCLKTIAESEFVVGTAMHAIIVADALGVPSRLVESQTEPEFKYRDYFEGTGRTYSPAPDIAVAVAEGAQSQPKWDRALLQDAFPADLWALKAA